MMLLVIDVQKGVQTQTGECLVIAELLQRKLILVINKIDLLEETKRELQLSKLNGKLRNCLGKTSFGLDTPIFNISALSGIRVQQLLNGICSHVFIPKRNTTAPFIMYIDHCFPMKGKGTICTGTVIQGQVSVNDSIEIPLTQEQRKVRSIQMFRRPVHLALMGDRIGLRVSKFNSKQLERGIITQPGYLRPVYAACIYLERVKYYKFSIKSNKKLHITVAHDTVMSNVILYRTANNDDSKEFILKKEYQFLEELKPSSTDSYSVFALLQFETPILAAMSATVIASKLDLDPDTNFCRLAFWGHIQWLTHSNNYVSEDLPKLNIFKLKFKQGSIQRLINTKQVIVQNLFKNKCNRDLYLDKSVELSTGEIGAINEIFGQTSKVKIHFPDGIKPETLSLLNSRRSHEILVQMKFKKYIFNKSIGFIQ